MTQTPPVEEDPRAASPVRAAIISCALLVVLLAIAAFMTAGSPRGAFVGEWVGETAGAEGPREVSLHLGDDGRVSGTDGCNRLIGGWHMDGDAAALDDLASTLMFCEGVDTWLSTAARAEVAADGSLRVFDGSGAEIGALARAHG